MRQLLNFIFGVAVGVYLTVDIWEKHERNELIDLQNEVIRLQELRIEQLQRTEK
jgi:hypothetical protein